MGSLPCRGGRPAWPSLVAAAGAPLHCSFWCSRPCPAGACNAQPFAPSLLLRPANSQSLSPVRWLAAFGHAINAGVNGDRDAPLALAAEPQRWWRLRVTLHGATGVPVQLWSQPYVKGRVHSSAVLLPKAK